MHRIRFLAILVLPYALFAQTASLTGRVTDPSGALVGGARITLSPLQGTAIATRSSREGAYSFASLAPGGYTIQAAAPNLSLRQPVGLTLASGPRVLDLSLEIAAQNEEVTVSDSAGPSVGVEASNNATAVVLKGEDLDALGDNPDDLQADLQALAGPGAGPNGGSIFIDGFSGGELPPKSSIREIRINQNPFSPEYDKLGYGRVEILTKPGTDKWRGAFNYNLQNELWNSRNPYAATKPPLRLNEFEGGVSGRLNHRASLTLDWEYQNIKNGSIVNAVTLDPVTLIASPFSAIRTTPQTRLMITPRVDYQLSANHTLTVRYASNAIDIGDAGIGSFDLVTRGYHLHSLSQTAQVTESAVIGTAVNETRVQYFRTAAKSLANSLSPAILVLGAFNGGGSQIGQTFHTQNSAELQNNTSMLRGVHSWRFGARLRTQWIDSVSPQNFGGSFTFGGGLAPLLNASNQPILDASGQPVLAQIESIERYRRTLEFAGLGMSPAQIRALGGGATQFTLTAGNPALATGQTDAGAFAGDDWRVRPNLTLSLGVRYEAQTHLGDRFDWAPRIGVAWAPGSGKSAHGKTVLRAGFGMFYDRFPLAGVLAARRYNGVLQQQYVVTNPDFFPVVPPLASLSGAGTTQAVQALSPTLRAPYLMQSAATVERQLPANTTLAVTFTNTHGLHQLRSQAANAPLPGTAIYPRGNPDPLFLMTSAGLYNQNQLIFNVNSKVNSSLSVYGFYVLNRARSNTDGLGTYPANAYNYSGEYAAASTDIHNRVNLGGSLNLPWHIRLNPYVNIQSGAPFDITAGSDLFGTTLFNGRPGIATDRTRPGLIQTAYGLLDPNPTASEAIVPRNYGRGPGMIAVNLRVGKTWGFGGERGRAAAPAESTSVAAPRAGNAPPPSGGGLTGGVANTTHRYNLTVSLSVRNLTNHTNPGPITGNITSPLFGQANQSAGSAGGSGIAENANNRRTEVQIRLAF